VIAHYLSFGSGRVEVDINQAELKRTTTPAVEVRRTYPDVCMPPPVPGRRRPDESTAKPVGLLARPG
jgi:hypothetical protein